MMAKANDNKSIKRKLKRLRKRTIANRQLCGFATPKSPPNQSISNRDRSPDNRKTPAADLGAEQRIALAGETVPLLFGKRVNGIGGVWIQPSLVKSGSYFFKGSFLFPVSQGQIVSNPGKFRTWVGLNSLVFLPDQSITLSHIYSSTASVVASPGTCPVLGAGMYCGNDTYSYRTGLAETSGTYTERFENIDSVYSGYRTIARGTGDTTNTIFYMTIDSVFDNDTGADITAAYFAYTGITSATQFVFNGRYDSSFNLIGGGAVGTVQDFIDDPVFGLGYQSPFTWPAAIGASGNITFVWAFDSINNQANPSNPATTGTLEGVEYEYIDSKYPDPNNTPTADNSSYADITFLKIVGDIYDPPEVGSYPTTTRQISAFYPQCIRVDLYSVNASGSSQGSSNQLVDLAMYLFTALQRNTPGTTPDVSRPILTSNMPSIATFCNEYGLHFNGLISEPLNVVEFLAETSPFFLLSFLSTGGQYRFSPVLPLNGSQEIDLSALSYAAAFTEDEILPGSYTKTYVSADEKTDVNCILLYRKSDPYAIGTQQTVHVRYSDASLDDPIEQFDMTDFCVSRDHAILYAKHFLARRRYSLHSIEFETGLDISGLIPTNIVKIEKQRISSAGDNRTEIDYYQITAIDHSIDGITRIEAAQFPVDGSSVPIISDEVLNGSFTVI